MSEDRDVVEESSEACLGGHADDFGEAVEFAFLLVTGAEEEVCHVVGESVAGAEGRVHGLDGDAELSVSLDV